MASKDQPWHDMAKSLAEELSGDAPIIARELFGEQWPGTTTMPDHKAAAIIQEAYQRGDRTFLGHLATQGPQQFLRVWKSLGGTVPPKPGEPIDMSGTPGGAEGPQMQAAQQGLVAG